MIGSLQTSRQRPLTRKARLGVCLCAGALCTQLASPPTPAQGKTLADPAPATTFPVSMTAKVTVNTRHPMARHWGLQCGAIVGTSTSTDAILEAINFARNSFQLSSTATTEQAAYDKFAQSILSPAHYYGSETVVGGELKDGAYTGTHTVTVNVPVTQLIDPVTKAVYAQPVALVGCWITINERPALRARGSELVTKDNFNHVGMENVPYFTDETLVKSASP